MSRSLAFSARFILALGLLAASGLSCDSPHVEPLAKDKQGLDDRLTLRGQVCSRAPDADGFPVKVVFLVDKSGSMCITDPPGSQSNTQSICQTFAAGINPAANPDNYCEPDNNAHPGRTCAIYQLLNQFKDKANVSVALVPFETKISGAFPAAGGFGAVTGGNFNQWVTTINDMQGSLGQGTDYQGAFAEAYDRIATDIQATRKSQRPRTRYVLVFLTDGTPFPRCAADDALPAQDYATPTNPDALWPDSPGAGCPGDDCFCNADQAYLDDHPLGSGFVGGTDRNQNYQLYDLVDRVMDLKKQYDIADIRVHTILLWNTGNIERLCAMGLSLCQDIFGATGSTDPVAGAHAVAEHLLRQVAEQHGNGTFQEFNTVAQIQLGALDYTSLSSPFVMKNLLVQNLSARPAPTGGAPDSDGDGIPDSIDSAFNAGTSKFAVDSDSDGFDDHFEWTHRDQGFNPANDPDPRGCKDTPQHQATCSCNDTDGDGLSECAELQVKSDPTLLDSDTDGVPDGLEVAYGMDPAVKDSALQDSDGDGTPDLLELKQHTDPLVADAQLNATEGYRYAIEAHPEDGGRTCYDFAVSNIRMVTPQAADGTQHGYNHLRLWFDQAPASNTDGDYGEWRIACATAQYAPPSVRVPAGPELQIPDQAFQEADLFDPTQCVEAQ